MSLAEGSAKAGLKSEAAVATEEVVAEGVAVQASAEGEVVPMQANAEPLGGPPMPAWCRDCDESLDLGAKFCPNCGSASISVGKDVLTCGACQNALHLGARFCSQCGQKTDHDIQMTAEQQTAGNPDDDSDATTVTDDNPHVPVVDLVSSEEKPQGNETPLSSNVQNAVRLPPAEWQPAVLKIDSTSPGYVADYFNSQELATFHLKNANSGAILGPHRLNVHHTTLQDLYDCVLASHHLEFAYFTSADFAKGFADFLVVYGKDGKSNPWKPGEDLHMSLWQLGFKEAGGYHELMVRKWSRARTAMVYADSGDDDDNDSSEDDDPDDETYKPSRGARRASAPPNLGAGPERDRGKDGGSGERRRLWVWHLIKLRLQESRDYLLRTALKW